eukprot:12403969-Karenia_brevis.AAC.1
MSIRTTSMPVYLGPAWHPKSRGAKTLAEFLEQHGGTVKVQDLKPLYSECPNLKLQLGNLVLPAVPQLHL